MAKSLVERVAGTKEGNRLYQQECAILDVTELVCGIMKEASVTRSELANRMGKTKGYVSQLLDGSANMTIRTIADIFTALDHRVRFNADSCVSKEGPSMTFSFVFKRGGALWGEVLGRRWPHIESDSEFVDSSVNELAC